MENRALSGPFPPPCGEGENTPMSCNPGQGGLLHFGRGRKCQLDTHLKCVVLRGSWREMGRQYGALLKGELERTLEWANRLGSVESDRFFSPSDSPSGMAFMDALFGGISETSGLTLPELIRANGVEVAYGNELGGLLLRGGRCGALALDRTRSRDGRVVFCRNYDWLPSFRDLDLVVAVMEPEGERGALYRTELRPFCQRGDETRATPKCLGTLECAARKLECRGGPGPTGANPCGRPLSDRPGGLWGDGSLRMGCG